MHAREHVAVSHLRFHTSELGVYLREAQRVVIDVGEHHRRGRQSLLGERNAAHAGAAADVDDALRCRRFRLDGAHEAITIGAKEDRIGFNRREG